MSLLIVVRDRWDIISPKARFVIEYFEKKKFNKIYLVRDQTRMFTEIASDHKIKMATALPSIFSFYFLKVLQSPEAFRETIERRLMHKKPEISMSRTGFVSSVGKVFLNYFATTARSDKLTMILQDNKSLKVFLIDEYMSINTLDLGLLKKIGHIIYVSQDVPSEVFDFGDHIIASALMSKLESKVLKLADLVVASSERDRLRYIDNGAKNVVFYPNIYPIEAFIPKAKDKMVSIAIVFRSHWGLKNISRLTEIFSAIAKINQKVKIFLIGSKPDIIPNKLHIEHYEFLTDKHQYMNVISHCWIGINIGIHKGGTNERKYDYAMANLVVFSDILGARGDLLPHEYTFLDGNDLASKLNQLLSFGEERINEMGKENRAQALLIAGKQRKIFFDSMQSLLTTNSIECGID
jgi:hypothetical protein